MRILDCPHCQRRLRFPDADSGSSVVCPGCGRSFSVNRDESASRPRFPEETASVKKAVPPELPPKFVKHVASPEHAALPEGPEEEPEGLGRPIVTDEKNFTTDADGRRTKIVRIAFAMGALAGASLSAFSIPWERNLTRLLECLCLAPVVAVFGGVIAAIAVGTLFAPSEKDRERVDEVMESAREERKEKRKKRKRKRSPKSSESYQSDEGPGHTP